MENTIFQDDMIFERKEIWIIHSTRDSQFILAFISYNISFY